MMMMMMMRPGSRSECDSEGSNGLFVRQARVSNWQRTVECTLGEWRIIYNWGTIIQLLIADLFLDPCRCQGYNSCLAVVECSKRFLFLSSTCSLSLTCVLPKFQHTRPSPKPHGSRLQQRLGSHLWSRKHRTDCLYPALGSSRQSNRREIVDW